MLSPRSILGADYETMLNHFRKVSVAQSPEEFLRITKSMSSSERVYIGDLYRELRRAGFYPLEMSSNGGIVWGRSEPAYVLPAVDPSITTVHACKDALGIGKENSVCNFITRSMPVE